MFDTIILLKDGDKMNKYKKIGILVIIVIIIAITYFCFFKGNLGEKAIKEVQKYVESQNISFDEFKFIELNELSSDLFDKCQQGSGVLVSKVDGKYEYKDVMKIKLKLFLLLMDMKIILVEFLFYFLVLIFLIFMPLIKPVN